VQRGISYPRCREKQQAERQETRFGGQSCGYLGFAEILSAGSFPLGINDFDMARAPCTQSCPQKLCETRIKPSGGQNQRCCHIFQLWKIVN
jgi:hypothetical protein